MICGMFYEDEVSAQGSSSDWWRPYLNAAYSAGILKGTQASQQRASAGDWSASVAEAQISRYDMAQIMYHVAVDQGFEDPSAASLAYASARIQDFSSIPSNYQYAVLYSYAKGFLSGGQNGRFNGGNSTTRAEAAVVLCSLFEEQESLLSPTYNNSNRLTDNSAVTEENVSDLLRELEAEYPSFDQWNTDRVYTSKVLGRGSGEAGFAYMLSDRVFGAISSYELDDPEDLRVGDLIYDDYEEKYGLILSVDTRNETVDYATVDDDNEIDWDGWCDFDDLSDMTTRYPDEDEDNDQGDEELTNGKPTTERNVSNLLDDLIEDYEQGDSWDEDDKYTSDVLGSGYGDEAFAYFISDEIFGDLEDSSVREPEDLKTGDVVYDDNMERYGVVLQVDTSDDTVQYATVEDEEINWSYWCDFDDLSDMTTRYP